MNWMHTEFLCDVGDSQLLIALVSKQLASLR